jgi:hypothetical protein
MSEDLLSKIYGKLVLMERDIKGLQNTVKRLETGYDKLEKKVDENRTEVMAELAYIESKFDDRFDKLESILEYHRNKISQNEQDRTSLDKANIH